MTKFSLELFKEMQCYIAVILDKCDIKIRTSFLEKDDVIHILDLQFDVPTFFVLLSCLNRHSSRSKSRKDRVGQSKRKVKVNLLYLRMALTFPHFQQCIWQSHFLLENLGASEPSLGVLEKFQNS